MSYTIIEAPKFYFEALAHDDANGKTRFENLDTIDELNEFAEMVRQRGFNRIVVRAFDSQGFKSKGFIELEADGFWSKFYKTEER